MASQHETQYKRRSLGRFGRDVYTPRAIEGVFGEVFSALFVDSIGMVGIIPLKSDT
jgi:hypothetical protein